MKKTKLLKSLLMAAALCVGANVWAGTVSTIYEKSLTDWTSTDVTKTSGTVGAWYNSTGITTGDHLTGMMINSTYGLRLAARNTTATAVLTLDRTANTIVTIDAVWNVGSASADGNTPHTQFIYGDLLIQQNVRSDNLKTTYKINGKTTTVGTDKFAREDDMTIHLVVNSVSGEISEFYLKNGETTVAQFSDLTSDNNTFATGSDYDHIQMLSWISASSSYAWCAMKSLTVQQETQDVATATVTYKYVDTEGNSLSEYKADQTQEDVAVGTDISTLIASFNETFYNGTDNKYVYDSYTVTGDYTTVQSGSNTVTLKFTDYPATAYTVKAQVDGSDLSTIASGTAFLDGSTTVYYSKYLIVDNAWYETTSPYGLAITSATTNVAFTAINALDYYWEAEDMTYGRTYGTVSNNTSYSNGNGIGIYSGNAFTSKEKIAAGYYFIYGGAVVRNNSEQPYLISYSTDGETWTKTGKILYFAAGATTASIEVAIPEEAYIRLTENKGGNAQNYMDYFALRRINTMTIVGTFSDTAWDFTEGFAMTQSDDDPTIWTAVVEEYVAEAKSYSYKATANGVWGVLECGNNGENQTYDFTTAGAGTYRLVFTADLANRTVELSPVKQVNSTFIVAGTESFFGSNWDGTDENNKMEKNDDGTYSITYNDKALTAGTIEYKVVIDGSTWVPSDNQKIEIKDAATYDITITIDPTYNTVSHSMDVQKTITSAGYATYCSSYDLNFDGTGITAYIAKIEGTDVTFEEVTSAPANTGLLLKADEGSYPIAMETSSTTIENNALIGVLEDTEVAAGSFVLMNGTEGVGFYRTTKEFTVGANTAYIAALSEARSFIAINFDGTTTAIEGVATQSVNNGVVYDLQGRRVAAPQSGLYIINGKKVVIK